MKNEYDLSDVELRQLLIETAFRDTSAAAEAKLSSYFHESSFVAAVFSIALEGEDMGDAPWTAANTIEKMPTEMLLPHISKLETLAEEQWMYLHEPARRALARIAAETGQP